MKILVSGANGLVGRRLLSKLRDHHDVHAIVRSVPDDGLDGVQYHKVDLGREWDTASLPEGVDVVFHLAQSENFRNFPDCALDIFKVNVDSTARLLDYAHKTGVKRFVYASSGGVYGSGNHVFHENSPITSHGKLGYYLGSKLCSEILVENYAPHMQVNIVRFFFVYGPEQKPGMLIPRLIHSVREGRPIQLQGDNGISINPIHVSDATAALEKIMTTENSVKFNLAGTEIFSIRDIATIAGELLGKEPVFENVAGQGQNLIADIGLMRDLLVAPSLSLRDGVKEFL